MQNKRKLLQAKNRHAKSQEAALRVAEAESDALPVVLDYNRFTRQSGPLQKKELCIWCMKPDNKKNTGDSFHQIQQLTAWARFKEHTIFLKEDQMRDRILAVIAATHDPFATEIYYHRSCWKKHIRLTYETTDSAITHAQNMRINEVKELFFQHVRKVVLDLNEPRTLQGLLLDYRNIADNFGFSTEGIKTSKIKQMLADQFPGQLGFHDRYHKNQSTLVYDVREVGSFIEAAIYSWGISNEQLLNTAARRLRDELIGTGMIWPPTIEEIETEEKPDPLMLKFLTWLKTPATKKFETCSDPQVSSLASLLKSYTNGKRSVFKTKLSCTIHGLTRSRELIDLTKKLGLGISYQDVKNLYATWALQDIRLGCCPREIASGYPATAVMDNDDFKDDTLTGADTSHRTNVMFVQREELQTSCHSDRPVLATHNDLRAVADDLNKVRPYKTIRKGVSPIRNEFDTSPSTTVSIRKEEMMHTCARIDHNFNSIDAAEQKVGSFGGFQSIVQNSPARSKAHYFLTLPKAPHKSVVHEVMLRLIAVINDKDLPFMQLVGDQPVYTLIVQLRNENRAVFEKILPILGPFHTQCSFITAINKRFSGSGLSDLIVSADIVAEKSIDQALRGKHYRRAIRALQLTYEALQRRIIQAGRRVGHLLSDSLQVLLEKLRNPSEYQLEELQEAARQIMESNEFSNFMTNAYKTIEEYNSPMANYWLTFMEMVEILMMNIHSLKIQDWSEFKASIRLMIPWMQVYDNNHYGKWLVEFWAEISSLPKEVAKYMEEGLFAHSMSGKPYTCLPLDLWIEMTMNKGSKLKAGWKNILKNETMLLSHSRTANYVNRARASLHKTANLKTSNSNIHKENTATRLKIDEIAVQDLDKCIVEFECDPFDPSNNTLRTLQSGQVAPPDLQEDLLTAKSDGENLTKRFLQDRIFTRNMEFDSVMHRNSRRNFNSSVSDKHSEPKLSKSAAMENEAMSAVVANCCGKDVSLTTVMENRVTQECLSIFNTNGAMVKVQKSKLLEMLHFVPLSQSRLKDSLALIDMGFMWRLSTPTSEDREKGDESVFTWKDYATKMFFLITSRHPTASTIILVNDPYDLDFTIKDCEHDRRAKYTGGSKNVYIRRHEKLPNSRDFNEFFKNKKNKIRLQEFLKNEFAAMVSGESVKMLYSVQSDCYDLTNKEKVLEFECHHLEADTIIFYIYAQLRKMKRQEAVVIDAEDTDVVVLSARVSHEIQGLLGIRRKKEVFDCQQLCSEEMSKIVVQLHVNTGADAVSGFFGHGKMSVAKSVMKHGDIVSLEGTV
eukprot:Seg4270.2 transcript_id=Seg4270.2/GoldUCD/mRNA.D3Y31 product="hypothetical protein" protein_id=Seg4270.2/GoldUCD/D3Y31